MSRKLLTYGVISPNDLPTHRPTTFLDFAAKAISGLASPFLVILAAGVGTIHAVSAGSGRFGAYAVPFAVLIIGLPLAFVLVGMRLGRITDIHVELKEQRGGLFIVATLASLLLAGYYALVRAPISLVAFALALTVNGVAFFLVSRYWKASVHSASIVGSAVILGAIVDRAWYALVLALPLVAWARIRRNKHSLAQTIAAAVGTGLATWATLAAFGIR